MGADSRWAARRSLEPDDIRAAERRILPRARAYRSIMETRPWPVIPRPDHAPFPRRIAGCPSCPECGMTDGHWAGCSEPALAVAASGPIR